MLPLGDDNSDRRTIPFVTYALIAINVLVFVLLELPQGQNLDAFLTRWGTIPAQIVAGNGLLTLITSMFLHGGWLHLGSNMLFLWIFGDNIEDTFGHWLFLLFYLVCGIAASLAQVLMNTSSDYTGRWRQRCDRRCAGRLHRAIWLTPGAGADERLLNQRAVVCDDRLMVRHTAYQRVRRPERWRSLLGTYRRLHRRPGADVPAAWLHPHTNRRCASCVAAIIVALEQFTAIDPRASLSSQAILIFQLHPNGVAERLL